VTRPPTLPEVATASAALLAPPDRAAEPLRRATDAGVPVPGLSTAPPAMAFSFQGCAWMLHCTCACGSWQPSLPCVHVYACARGRLPSRRCVQAFIVAVKCVALCGGGGGRRGTVLEASRL
jgi:hypothetical protein